MRRTVNATTYVWKAEVQQRGQIHYHITTPKYIHYRDIRDKWNSIQKTAGWLDDYTRLYGGEDPNSTDVHEVRHVKDLSNYLKKEYCKAIQNPVGEGKIWDCSKNLKKHKYYTINESQYHNETISELLDKEKVTALQLDKCLIIQMKKKHPTEILQLNEIQGYNEFLKMIRFDTG
jgi:hypothetical protein